MDTLYLSSIVKMISTRSSDVTPSSDSTESGVIADRSKWACRAITALSTSVIVPSMFPAVYCFCLRAINTCRLRLVQAGHEARQPSHQLQILHRLRVRHCGKSRIDSAGGDIGPNAGRRAYDRPSPD